MYYEIIKEDIGEIVTFGEFKKYEKVCDDIIDFKGDELNKLTVREFFETIIYSHLMLRFCKKKLGATFSIGGDHLADAKERFRRYKFATDLANLALKNKSEYYLEKYGVDLMKDAKAYVNLLDVPDYRKQEAEQKRYGILLRFQAIIDAEEEELKRG